MNVYHVQYNVQRFLLPGEVMVSYSFTLLRFAVLLSSSVTVHVPKYVHCEICRIQTALIRLWERKFNSIMSSLIDGNFPCVLLTIRDLLYSTHSAGSSLLLPTNVMLICVPKLNMHANLRNNCS